MTSDSQGIFISYRRDETAGYAGRLADRLNEHFGEHEVFWDIDSIEPGLDFVEAIQRTVDSSEVLIVVIGRNWTTTTDVAGRQRLQNPNDYVRMEIAAALRRNIRVIPVLVQGASMPTADELPDELAPLTRRNAFELHDASWRDDVRRLVNSLERVVGHGEEIQEPVELSNGAILESLEWVDRPDTGRVFVVNSFAEIERLCKVGKVLLFGVRAERGSGERNALGRILTRVLPQVAPIATSQGVFVCFSNIGGIFRLNDLAEYLRKRALRSQGCFLFQDGRLDKYKKLGWSYEDDKWITAAQELLED